MKKLVLAAAVFLGLSTAADAALITVGSLSRDTSSDTIVDTLNGREWLGWDVTRGWTYEQTVAATGLGGDWGGYRIARNADMQLFADALLGANACTASNHVECGRTGPDTDALLGESYFGPAFFGNLDVDLAMFLSDNGVGEEVGLAGHYTHYEEPSLTRFEKSNERMDFGTAASFTSLNVGWALYRETAVGAVPEPTSLALVALGLLAGTAATCRRKC